MALVECIPNISEGRRPEVIEAITAVVADGDVKLLSVAPDFQHNRTVLHFVGPPDQVAVTAMRVAEAACRLIDLNQHWGEHPRMGALDVLPFVPATGLELADCVLLARRVAADLAARLGVPVFLYGEAALRPGRTTVADVRRAGFEALRVQVGNDPALTPDFGPPQLHPTAGGVAVGARMPQITLLVSIRGGSPGSVERVESDLGTRGIRTRILGPDQLLITVDDYRRQPLQQTLAVVRAAARAVGAQVQGIELLGHIPLAALAEAAAESLGLKGFRLDQVLEKRLLE